jgi:hypothetical protein
MKKSDIKNLVREAVSTKIKAITITNMIREEVKAAMGESIGADIDIIAQESTDFADFLNNVKADPSYKNVLDVNDPQTKEFLQSIFDEA